MTGSEGTASMHRLTSLLRMIAIVVRHGTSASGDVAIHKADAFLGRVRPSLAAALAPIDPVVPPVDMPALRALPRGLFGRSYADFLDAHGLHPFVITERTDPAVVARNVHWARYAVVHDMFHVLLGAGPDLAGEAKVYAFTLAQRVSWMLWLFVPLATVVLPLLAPHRIGAMLRGVREGWTIGRAVPCLMAVRLEDRFETPTAELREALGLPAVPPEDTPARASPGRAPSRIDEGHATSSR